MKIGLPCTLDGVWHYGLIYVIVVDFPVKLYKILLTFAQGSFSCWAPFSEIRELDLGPVHGPEGIFFFIKRVMNVSIVVVVVETTKTCLQVYNALKNAL